MSESRRACGSEEFQARGITAPDHELVDTVSQKTGSHLNATTVACLQEQVTNLDGERLPSEMVGNPNALGSGWYALTVAVVL